MPAKEKNFNVFRITSTPFRPELMSGLLWELDLEGITEEDNFILVYTDEGINITSEKIEQLLNGLVNEGFLEKFIIEKNTVENKNWNEIWEKSREVIRISDKIVIKPTFKEYIPQTNELVLTIDPKMSFGTGEHQTTQLVLNLLERYVKPGMKVLDVGSGTGVLAITAVKLGAASAVAVDNDEWCYENCKENAELNNVSNSIKIITGDIKNVDEKGFDLVLANIQKNILLEILDDLKMKIKENGMLILSGLLLKDEEEIMISYSDSGFTFVEKSVKDDWISLVFNFNG
ncbi:50S ribosomal protein L11 methyltransferase [bacterium BMS3Abin03]|nr:50S ribosomal protein L11 methyltransferase [bacterium BMS3Abin03]MCG6961163.1 50S ribosomal protein L11 methyltransferase [bacterium BMS3Abin03]